MSWSNKRRRYFKAYNWRWHQFVLFRTMIVSEISERLSKRLDEAILYGENYQPSISNPPEFSCTVAMPDNVLPLLPLIFGRSCISNEKD